MVGSLVTSGGLSAVSGRVEELVAPILERDGYEVILVELLPGRGRPSLTIYIDRLDHEGRISLDDCVRVTRLLSEFQPLDDLFPGAYNLEISSPGVNRPLVRERDYVRFVGERIQVDLLEPIDERRRFTGRLMSVKDGEVLLTVSKDKETVSIPMDRIAKASLKPESSELFKKR